MLKKTNIFQKKDLKKYEERGREKREGGERERGREGESDISIDTKFGGVPPGREVQKVTSATPHHPMPELVDLIGVDVSRRLCNRRTWVRIRPLPREFVTVTGARSCSN